MFKTMSKMSRETIRWILEQLDVMNAVASEVIMEEKWTRSEQGEGNVVVTSTRKEYHWKNGTGVLSLPEEDYSFIKRISVYWAHGGCAEFDHYLTTVMFRGFEEIPTLKIAGCPGPRPNKVIFYT